MGQEIERKFLVVPGQWQPPPGGLLYRQGYIPTTDARTVRVRMAGERAYLTIKGPAVGLVRSEFEYSIPPADGEALLKELCEPPLIEKWRYRVTVADVVWEIDRFLGANTGLILAEVELTDPNQPLSLPPWVGAEVTHDPRYFNSTLAQHPVSTWDPAPVSAPPPNAS